MALVRRKRERAAVERRYRFWQFARDRCEPCPRGGCDAVPPDEQHRVLHAWVAYEAEDAVAAASETASPPTAANNAGQHETTSDRFFASLTGPD